METIFIAIGIGFVIFLVVGIIGSVFSWAGGLIKSMFSIAVFAALALVVIYFVNGQQLPF